MELKWKQKKSIMTLSLIKAKKDIANKKYSLAFLRMFLLIINKYLNFLRKFQIEKIK